MIEPGDEVVLLYVILPKSQWDEVKLPKGCFAKAYETGPIDRMTDVSTCRGWGAMMAASINRLAKKLCPESLILMPPPMDN